MVRHPNDCGLGVFWITFLIVFWWYSVTVFFNYGLNIIYSFHLIIRYGLYLYTWVNVRLRLPVLTTSLFHETGIMKYLRRSGTPSTRLLRRDRSLQSLYRVSVLTLTSFSQDPN